jgi:hypothetical protein
MIQNVASINQQDKPDDLKKESTDVPKKSIIDPLTPPTTPS